MTLLSRLLATFALGLIATGVVLGFLPGGDCGKAFSGGKAFDDPSGCGEVRAQRREIPIGLIGIGLTAAVAAVVTTETRASQRP